MRLARFLYMDVRDVGGLDHDVYAMALDLVNALARVNARRIKDQKPTISL